MLDISVPKYWPEMKIHVNNIKTGNLSSSISPCIFKFWEHAISNFNDKNLIMHSEVYNKVLDLDQKRISYNFN